MELEQLEALALSSDREQALAQLIPGTEDHYFFRCLEHLHVGEFEATAPLLAAWVKRHGETERVREIRDRQALLSYTREPERAREHIRRRLGVTFNHRREVEDAQSDLPTRLDPATIGRAAFLADALRHHANVDGLEDRAFEWLIVEPKLELTRLRALLQRLERPDYPGLVDAIVRELDDPHSNGFGRLKIHRLLTLAQLDELGSRRPGLGEQPTFVELRITRLRPGPEVNLDDDLDARAAHLERVWAYVQGRAPAFNSLAVHVLYHRLELDQRRGSYDRATFERYIQLPRQAANVSAELRERHHAALAQLDRDFSEITGLAPVNDDSALVRDYLEQLFGLGARGAVVEDYRGYQAWLDEDYLRRVFAETQILAGVGDAERWYSLLDNPGYYKALEQRVEILLAPQNPRRFAGDAPVELIVDLKRVSTLVVKVFEVNALAYFLAHGRSVASDVDLDGLVANDERLIELDAPALRRVRHTLGFDSLARPGTYVIELIGNGKSSRAVIRKGSLRYVERRTAAGHALTILDDAGQPAPGATAWFGGREFRPDDRGELRIPYGSGGPAQMLLRCGALATVVEFSQRPEHYELRAGILVDHEQLIAGATAQVVIATTLMLADVVVDPSLIRAPTLTIRSEDRDGISSSVTVPLPLDAAAEAVHGFTVPDALRRLEFVVRGEVRSVTAQRDIELSSSTSIAVNELDGGSEVADLHLSKTAEGYVLYVLGKSGEVRPGVEVGLIFSHLDFRARVHVRLQTDARGRIELGGLAEIRGVEAALGTGRRRDWVLTRPGFRLAPVIHTARGRDLLLPRPAEASVGAALSLLERGATGYVRDRSDALSLEPDGLRVRGLEPGDYALTYKLEGQSTTLRVGGPTIASTVGGEWALSGDRLMLELSPAERLRVAELQLDDASVRIRLAGLTGATRVHVFARRFASMSDSRATLDLSHDQRPNARRSAVVRSSYLSGRDIGDEYRYILDRKRATPFAGNMLERPSLLLNPWALRKTATGLARAASGSAYAEADDQNLGHYGAGPSGVRLESVVGTSSSLDFLPASAFVAFNLEPDEDGVVTLARAQLGDATLVQFVAVDEDSQVSAELALPETALEPRDRRLLNALDSGGHFVLRKQRACLAGDAELIIEDLRTAKLEAVDSVGKAHALLLTLSDDPHLREFEFITRWPSLTADEQRERYSKYACHELNLFLARKDPEFFAAVIAPYLANKRDKTFMDHYLLGADLHGYLELWAYGQLNVVEKILLAGRIPSEREPSARHVHDRFDLLPPDLVGDNAAFDTALQGSALTEGGALAGLAEESFGGQVMRGGSSGGPPPPRQAPPAPAAPAAPSAPALLAPGPPMSRNRSASRSVRAEIAREDLAERDQVRRFYQAADKTEEWAENNYYRRRIAEQGPELITVNGFWRDFADRLVRGEGPFLSGQFVRATGSFAEMLCALAVLDLPFEAGTPTKALAEARLTLRAGAPMIVFHEQITPITALDDQAASDVLVSQSYFRSDDRYRYENNQRHDKYVRGELLVHTVYVCQIVLTNPSSSAHQLDLLVQIPRGAVPVANGFETRDLHVALQPRGTHAIEYSFYFPGPGRFEHFPVHVAKHEGLVAFAEPTVLEVVTRLRRVDTESWSHVSQHGADAELLRYLETNNLDRLALDRIAWRMREREMFDATLALLRRRHVYSDTLWSYALMHGDPAPVEALAEYLREHGSFLRGCGLALDSPLVATEPVERRWYQHLEYAPLINARAHPLGGRRKILNAALEAQYRAFLATLTYVAQANEDQLVVAAYYALLQDRVAEGLALLDRVAAERVTGTSTGTSTGTLYWDYMQAYVALYRGELGLARELGERHRAHPVARWAKRFAHVVAILDEAEGAAGAVVDADDRQQAQSRLAGSEASFDFEVEGSAVVLSYQNLAACQLSFYRMDIELLFSRQPFMQDQSDRFAIVQPNYTEALELAVDRGQLRVELPAELRSANTIIEVVAGGVRRSKANYAHDLSVRVIEPYGQLRVHERSSAKTLARAYVKVYARTRGGEVGFYKDGYTDLRGAFDYASLSTDELDRVERFALLVVTEAQGALIREVAPPRR